MTCQIRQSPMPCFLLWTTLSVENKRQNGLWKKRWIDSYDVWSKKLASRCSRQQRSRLLHLVDGLEQQQSSTNERKSLTYKLYVLWKFCRPHTFIGTLTAISSLTILANEYVSQFLQRVGNNWCENTVSYKDTFLLWKYVYRWFLPCNTTSSSVGIGSRKLSDSLVTTISQSQGWTAILGFLTALVPALLINVYIVGLNQLFDIEIDQINKPYLPLASKELSVRWAWVIVTLCGSLGLILGLVLPKTSVPLIGTLFGSTLLGSMYSIPPIRLKRYPLFSSFCILVVRGVLVNIGFSQHARIVAGYGASLSPCCWFYSIFFALFGICIALMKDIPDVKGDRMFHLRSFSVILGPQVVFRWTVLFLTGVFFVSSYVLWLIVPILFCKWLLVGCHLVFGLALWMKSFHVDAENSKQVYEFYMFLWKVFYGVYILLPLAG
ncbi:homogenitisate phytyltransferase [Galdieria sulphuraria]|uniref:Homogenitisate phytyltransferase n=1 Tax=Galdieria sulphuraria TaxID=130081 RepID=M2Y0B6_GALSU|nr:homogenitisate phytyltransferase [Galdieria sulphuraria]EME29279.1 homogenitisate phytyltransferase [Galdieria sulphuraria]|eukprot:XP_005705799.1 homogenitisate phytyltransferase [Galdieria sulphuraria]